MKKSYTEGLKTSKNPKNNAIRIGGGINGYTTAEDVYAFFASVKEDFHLMESSSEDFEEAA